MKIHKGLIFGLTALLAATVPSCKKDTIKGESSNEVVQVYLPAAGNPDGLLSILDKSPVKVDLLSNTVNFSIPIYRGGFISNEPFTVDVSVDDKKVADLIAKGALPANTVLLNASSYLLNTKDSVRADNFIVKGTIVPKLKLDQLMQYAGKTAALAIRISNPSKYTINEQMNTVVMYFDVDKLSKDYLRVPINIVNPGFENGYAGWVTQAGLGELKNAGGMTGKDLNFWTSKVTSAHVLQTVNDLPNGNYTLSAWYKSAGTNMYVYANGKLLLLSPANSWTAVNLDFTVTEKKAEFGFKAIDATGNFSVWEPWCDMDDFTLIRHL